MRKASPPLGEVLMWPFEESGAVATKKMRCSAIQAASSVSVANELGLAPLAKAGCHLAEHAQQLSRGADVFLASEKGEHLGRACHWRECGSGIRQACDALHCGRRHYLHDDLRSVKLAASLAATPPIELWPTVQVSMPVPGDVEKLLLAPLRAGSA